MRAAIGRNDASAMDLLLNDRHVTMALDDLQIAVVGGGKHWGALAREHNASLLQRPIFVSVELMSPISRVALGEPLLRLRSKRRNASIRTDDHRSAPRERHLDLTQIQTELRHVVVHFGLRSQALPARDSEHLFR